MRWDEIDLTVLAERAVVATLVHVGVPKGAEVAVLAADDARISALNAEFRGKPQPTNVLSWPREERGTATPGDRPDLPPENQELGDLALAYDTCAREADAAQIPLAHHATHLIVHGTLHLLGYDHEGDSDGDLMEATETAILSGLGVPDPYSR
ncbi:MAG: rRNA maturation RNase YbeY [Pseudomonadota bacterium]